VLVCVFVFVRVRDNVRYFVKKSEDDEGEANQGKDKPGSTHSVRHDPTRTGDPGLQILIHIWA